MHDFFKRNLSRIAGNFDISFPAEERISANVSEENRQGANWSRKSIDRSEIVNTSEISDINQCRRYENFSWLVELGACRWSSSNAFVQTDTNAERSGVERWVTYCPSSGDGGFWTCAKICMCIKGMCIEEFQSRVSIIRVLHSTETLQTCDLYFSFFFFFERVIYTNTNNTFTLCQINTRILHEIHAT